MVRRHADQVSSQPDFSKATPKQEDNSCKGLWLPKGTRTSALSWRSRFMKTVRIRSRLNLTICGNNSPLYMRILQAIVTSLAARAAIRKFALVFRKSNLRTDAMTRPLPSNAPMLVTLSTTWCAMRIAASTSMETVLHCVGKRPSTRHNSVSQVIVFWHLFVCGNSQCFHSKGQKLWESVPFCMLCAFVPFAANQRRIRPTPKQRRN